MIPKRNYSASVAGTALALMASLVALPTSAALQELGNGLIQDSDLGNNAIWVQNGNLFATQVQDPNHPNLVQTIIDLTPSLHDPSTHQAHVLSAGEFVTDPNSPDFGKLSWFAAMAWVNWLNQQNYGGYSDWRLPQVRPQDGIGFVFDGSKGSDCSGENDLGYNYTGTESELAHLFYDELLNHGQYEKTPGDCPLDSLPEFGLINSSPFVGLKNDSYWTETVFPGADFLSPPGAGIFTFSNVLGQQWREIPIDPNQTDSFAMQYALPVRSDAAPSPSPSPSPSATPTPTPTATPTATPAATPRPAPTAIPTPVAGDYDFTNASCARVGRRGNIIKFTVSLTNAGIKPRRAAKLQVVASQDGQAYATKRRTVSFAPSKEKTLSFTWRSKAVGKVRLNATLLDRDAREEDVAQDQISCSISGG